MSVGGVVFFLTLFTMSGSAVAAPTAPFVYHGRILKPDNSPELDPAVQFKIQIRSPGTENCLLYEETQTVNMAGSNGTFALTLNSSASTRTDSTGYSIEQIMGNLGTFTLAGGSCSTGTTYSPSLTDGRAVQVYFKDSTMGSFDSFPANLVAFVPKAIDAEQVSGFPVSSLLRVQNGSTPGTATALTTANMTQLMQLLNGTSTLYVQAGNKGAELPTFASNPTSPLEGDVWYNTTTHQIEYYDGTSSQPLGAGGGGSGTVTQIIAGTGLSGGTITTSGTISLPNTGTAGTYTKVTTDAQGRVTSGTNITGADITSGTIGGTTSVNTSGTITASSVSANSLLLYSGVKSITVNPPAGLVNNLTWTLPGSAPASNGYVLSSTTAGVLSWAAPASGTVTSVGLSMPGVFSVSGSPLTTSGTLAVTANGTSGGIPYFDSATTMASSAALSQYQVVLGGGAGAAPTVVAGTGSAGQILTSNGAGAAPTWQPASGSSQWTTSGSNIYYNTGNVGIGTTSPSSILSLSGQASQTVGLERNSTANSAGNDLTIRAGGATLAATNKAGGNLNLNAGVSTGSGGSGNLVKIGAYPGFQTGGTADLVSNSTLQVGYAGAGIGVDGTSVYDIYTPFSVSQNNLNDNVLGGRPTAYLINENVGTDGAYLVLSHQRSGAAVLAGDTAGRLDFRGLDSGGVTEVNFAGIRGVVTSPTHNAATGKLIFSTANATAFTPVDQMTIDGSGNVGIGTSNPANSLDVYGGGGIHISTGVPASTAAALYNVGGTLMWNGSALGGGTFSSITGASGTDTLDNTNFAQTWNWSTATTQNPMTMTSNALTTGSLLSLTSSSASLNSTNGLLYVANTGASTTGEVARIQSNSTAGSGLTVLANGNVGIGTATPSHDLSFGGASDRTIWLERNPAASAGGNLFIQGGGAGAGANLNGGAVILQSGAATGNGGSDINLEITNGSQGAGSTVRQPSFATSIAYFSGVNRSIALGESETVTGQYSFGINLDGSSAQTLSQANTMAIMGGNVGIGTTSPQERLDVVGNVAIPYSFYLKADGYTNTNMVGTYWNGSNDVLYLAPAGNSASSISFATANTGLAAATSKMTITSGGNVGIGTTNPGHQLSVVANVPDDSITVQNLSNAGASDTSYIDLNGVIQAEVGYSNPGDVFFGGNAFIYTKTGTNLAFENDSGVPYVLFNTTSGNVGIGTSTPNSMLNLHNGAIVTDTQGNAAGVTNINFLKGNVQTSANSTLNAAFKLCGLQDGGSYTLVLTAQPVGSTPTFAPYSDAACTATITNFDTGGVALTTTSATTLITFIRAGSTVYAVIATGFTH